MASYIWDEEESLNRSSFTWVIGLVNGTHVHHWPAGSAPVDERSDIVNFKSDLGFHL